jgi:hypothetical protein
MTAQAPDHGLRQPVEDYLPDLAAVMMAIAMAEMFQDEPGCPLPETLAAILQQMKPWDDEQARHAA